MLVVDTSVLIAHLRGSKEATDLLLGAEGHDDIQVPALVAWELWKGTSTPAERERVGLLLGDLTIDPMTGGIARLAGELHVAHRERGSERPAWDLLIAAHALFHGAALATADRDFAEMEGLRILRVAPGRRGVKA